MTMKTIRKVIRPLAVIICLNMLLDLVWPLHAYALTSGPSQPEVESFQPVSVSDMVNPFTGDFSYNIPLLDVDGYPINLAYCSGISSDQEASWVGLGWNINPGAITRNLRGIPDEFNGDVVETEYNLKKNWTLGGSITGQFETFGLKTNLGLGLSYTLGVNYNSYNGFGNEQGISAALSASKGTKGTFTAELGLTTSENGLSVSPSLSYEKKGKDAETQMTTSKRSFKAGCTYNSRAGLSGLTLSVNSERVKFRENKNTRHGSGRGSGNLNFGLSTYTPSINLPMKNFSINGSYGFGGEVIGFFTKGHISVYYSEEKMNLKDGKHSVKAYGYLNSQNVNKDEHNRVRGMMDVNRSWDVPYTKNTPSLPVTNHTFDILSVSGQGVGGTFRPFRNDFGCVSDNLGRNTSLSGSIGLDLGAGNIIHGGIDLSGNYIETVTGNWVNAAGSYLQWKSSGDDLYYEPYSFKEMGEMSVDDETWIYDNLGTNRPTRIVMEQGDNFWGSGNFEIYTVPKLEYGDSDYQIDLPVKNYRKKRQKRNQAISILTFEDLQYKGLRANKHKLYAAPNHHTAEISVIREDGIRYVYGVPAFNMVQEETSFSVGQDPNERKHIPQLDENGLISYSFPNDNSKDNKNGRDHYYSCTKMPPFAHSYLLSAVLSPDYVDIDGTVGPSNGDIGNYTVFRYTKSDDPYRWRTPMGKNGIANYSEGLRSDYVDDKANYVYGERENWYLETIETKNSIAIFTLEPRQDGYEAASKNGGLGSKSLQLLRKITLYNKQDYENNGTAAIPIKVVHFEYDYTLCPHVPNNINEHNDIPNDQIDVDPETTGKLTLKKVYFTYGTSTKSMFSPYSFDYTNLYDEAFNPGYCIKDHDRWGGYKPNKGHLLKTKHSDQTNAEFPYIEQDKQLADKYTSAWGLSKINLPSGGTIKVITESDDYAYVQNQRAMQMFKVENIGHTNSNDEFVSDNNRLMESTTQLGSINRNNLCISFKLQEPIANGGGAIGEFRTKYLSGISDLYYKVLVSILNDIEVNILDYDQDFFPYDDMYEYVYSFAKLSGKSGLIPPANSGDPYVYGWIELSAVNQGDRSGSTDVNPISKTAWQFGRINMPDKLDPAQNILRDELGVLGFLSKLVDPSLITQTIEMFEGPNGALKNKDFGKKIIKHKSFIRLLNPNRKKLGGGLRVKRVELSDEWETMVSSNQSHVYGQEYTYKTVDESTGEEISSGVAIWEPQIGGDENPYYLPTEYKNNKQKILMPNDRFFLIGPMGEDFYPAPSVGYSKIEIKNIGHSTITRHGTGKVVMEYYTSKDFPIISGYTTIKQIHKKTNPAFRLFKLFNRDYMNVSQGYVVELNNMHGQQKAMWVYQQGSDKYISGVEYKYQCEKYAEESFRLTNDANIIRPNGRVTIGQIGMEMDFVTDFREQKTDCISAGANTNVSSFLAAIFPGVVPTIFPTVHQEHTRFRSAVATKVINRYGILSEVISHDLGSIVSTKNLAYDSETGKVLLTQTKNEFEDDIFSFNYPAHWYYDAMGQAYKNLGMRFSNLSFSSGQATISNASAYFVPGDELVVDHTHLAWVKEVGEDYVTLINKTGQLFTLSGSGHSMLITRSGRRNLLAANIGTIVSLDNPLDGLQKNKFSMVLNSSVQLFKDNWKTYCECFSTEGSFMETSKNPYAIGNKGVWRAYKALAFLTEREQSWKNNNTNIRRDGAYTTFNPYWQWNGKAWEEVNTNWIWTTEITQVSPYGEELENIDALQRYSGATYGYGNTVPVSVGANTKYRELAFDGFEDYDFITCVNDHFSYREHASSVANTAHTGKRSISVQSNGSTLSVTKSITTCE